MEGISLLAAIIDNAIDGIITIDECGTIETVNPAACSLFCYSPEELIGKNVSVLMPQPDGKLHDDYMYKYRQTGKSLIIGIGREVFGLRSDGAVFPFYLSVNEVVYSGRKIFAGFIHDLSREMAAEGKIKERAAELERLVEIRTQSLNSTILALQQAKTEITRLLKNEQDLGLMKSRFVSMASHEFRTPLSSVQLSADLILKYVEQFDKANVIKHVAKIKSSVASLTGILNDFLSLERLEAGKVEPDYSNFNIIEFAEEITGEMQVLAKPEQFIIYEHTGADNYVRLDRALLRNCIINLIGNAIKYSGEKSFIEFNTELTGAYFITRIHDNGIGIPETDQQHLFEPFYRAHNTGKIPGTGLGLNIVSRYAQIMKGQIQFESKINEGTSFTILFPI